MNKIKYYLLLLTVPVAIVVGCSSGITKEKYDQVKKGMSPDDVIAILGTTNDKMESDAVGLGKMETWSYNNIGYGGKLIIITFVNGRVNDKEWSE